MASAEVEKKKVKKVVEVEEEEIVLRLSLEEASTLLWVAGHIIGPSLYPQPRGFMDNIYYALNRKATPRKDIKDDGKNFWLEMKEKENG